MSTLSNKYHEAMKASSTENYTTVSVRAPMEVATMIDTVSLVTKEAVMNLFTSDLSEQLADYLLEDQRNMDLIVDILNSEYEKNKKLDLNNFINGSCIESLTASGNMSIRKESSIDYKKFLDDI